jgi:hypothetical protein
MARPLEERLHRRPPEEVAPRQSSPCTGKLSARPAGRPGSWFVKESLRRSLPHHFFPWLPTNPAAVALAGCSTEAPHLRFSRHGGIYPSDGGAYTQAWAGSHCLPPAVPNPSSRTCREDRALLIVRMSSDRLFLDRVARQHCPSPLHRHPQHNMHPLPPQAKPDISTLPGTGHFYFALTFPVKGLAHCRRLTYACVVGNPQKRPRLL